MTETETKEEAAKAAEQPGHLIESLAKDIASMKEAVTKDVAALKEEVALTKKAIEAAKPKETSKGILIGESAKETASIAENFSERGVYGAKALVIEGKKADVIKSVREFDKAFEAFYPVHPEEWY